MLKLTAAQLRALRAISGAEGFAERIGRACVLYLEGIAADQAAGSPTDARAAMAELDAALARVARSGKATAAVRIGDQMAGGDGADLVARMRAALRTPPGIRTAYRDGPRVDVHARMLGFNLACIVRDCTDGKRATLRRVDAEVARILEAAGHSPALTPHRLGRRMK